MLNPTALQDRLANLGDYETEIDATAEWGDILKSYLGAASIAQAPMTPIAQNAGAAAMSPALIGISFPGMGANKLQQGFIAFWAGVVATYAASTVAVSPPPGVNALASQLEPIFVNVTQSALPRAEAASLITAIIHAANQGGTWTMPPGLAGPIT